MHAIEIAYEQGILRKEHLSQIQRWALSYLIVDRMNKKNEDKEEAWKNQLFLADRSLFDRIYNPKSSESDLINEDPDLQGVDQEYDSDDLESYLASISSENSVRDSKLEGTMGEWT